MALFRVRVYSPWSLKELYHDVEADSAELARKKAVGATLVDPAYGLEFEIEDVNIIAVYPLKTVPRPLYKLMPEERVKRAKWLKSVFEVPVEKPLALGSEPVHMPKFTELAMNGIYSMIYSQKVKSFALRFLESYPEFEIGKKKYGPYTRGDIAHIPSAAKREELIEAGVAELAYPEFQTEIKYRRDIFGLFYEKARAMAEKGRIKEAILYLVEHCPAITIRQAADILGKCYDKETEVLTAEGFKKFEDVTYDDEIASLNPETEGIEYLFPVAIYKLRYKGYLVHFKGLYYDLMVTPEHLVYCKVYPYWKSHKNSNFEFHRAIDIYNNFVSGKYQLKRNARWSGNDLETFKIPPIYGITLQEKKALKQQAKKLYAEGKKPKEIADILRVKKRTVYGWVREDWGKSWMRADTLEKVPLEDWLKFFGWWITEGSATLSTNPSKEYLISIGQYNQKNLEEIVQISKRIGVHPSKCKDRVHIASKQLFHYLKQFGKAKDKFIPRWIKNLCSEKLDILLETMIKGDGCGTNAYFTSSRKLADDIQEIALKLGLASSCNEREDGRFGISIARKRCLTPTISKRPKLVYYDDYVYDLALPKNHILLVRRHGKVVWSSNSYWTCYRMTAELLGKQPPERIKELLEEIDVSASVDKWIPEEHRKTKEEVKAELEKEKAPKISMGKRWRGMVTLWPLKPKTEDELLDEAERVIFTRFAPEKTTTLMEIQRKVRPRKKRHEEFRKISPLEKFFPTDEEWREIEEAIRKHRWETWQKQRITFWLREKAEKE